MAARKARASGRAGQAVASLAKPHQRARADALCESVASTQYWKLNAILRGYHDSELLLGCEQLHLVANTHFPASNERPPPLFIGQIAFTLFQTALIILHDGSVGDTIMAMSAIREIWSHDEAVVNGWLSINNSLSAEIMAEQGFDSLTIDLQHGVIDYADAVQMLQAMRASGVAPALRVPWLDPGQIMKALDAGALMIICPMVNTPAQAEHLVSCMRYPPQGTRSFGPTRATHSAGPDYFANANENVVCLAMIETDEALTNLDAIVATPGLDGVYIGPADLALSVGRGRYPPGLDRREPELDKAIMRILEASHSAGIRAGIHCGDPAYAARAIDRGFDLITLSTDARILAAAAAKLVADTNELAHRRAGESG